MLQIKSKCFKPGERKQIPFPLGIYTEYFAKKKKKEQNSICG